MTLTRNLQGAAHVMQGMQAFFLIQKRPQKQKCTTCPTSITALMSRWLIQLPKLQQTLVRLLLSWRTEKKTTSQCI
ncbi:hypothetical protein ATCV1_z678R [Acanthocystis turfacea chlorella virus 1]|uniref:Uncharacterized protein z678R n=1 Tax=Chlorovirus heliozoae TaxID=322019 RepID=A7K9T8_9PHYC|nr:hypothetical protein ATCV1_z678R [Acanthocystis turfacea chlorella virus 1]ABT16812.1 hypothetical protein ATCV1_z678R [Acanthocystis turfacea chlorella virus 1]